MAWGLVASIWVCFFPICLLLIVDLCFWVWVECSVCVAVCLSLGLIACGLLFDYMLICVATWF